MAYIYDDGDNTAMNEQAVPDKPNVPTKSYADMRAEEEALPFTDPLEPPENACWCCTAFNGNACTINWNNADPIYYNPDTDDRDPFDLCDDFEWNGDYVYEE